MTTERDERVSEQLVTTGSLTILRLRDFRSRAADSGTRIVTDV
jgi:hypothetical protein